MVSDRFRPQIEVRASPKHRRSSVALEGLVLVPHFVALLVVAVGVVFVWVMGWFCALVAGRLPGWARRFLTGFLAWNTRVEASGMFLTNGYPEFSMASATDDVHIEIGPDKLSRWSVLFRLFLLLPAALVVAAFTIGWTLASVVIWLIVLIRGRTPSPLFEAGAAILRLRMRYEAYGYLLTSSYPLVNVMGDGRRDEAAGPATHQPPTRPLPVSRSAYRLLILFLVLGGASLSLSGATLTGILGT